MAPLDLTALAARLPPHPVTRYAPSPTGYLHLGHVANAVWVWGVARALDGRVVLRIEDHDRGRCRPEYEIALREDLDWLGLVPDAGAESGEPSDYRQSDCGGSYIRALAALEAMGLVYACACSRKEIAAEVGESLNQETPYPGRCRDRGLAPGPGRGLRMVMEPGREDFTDAMLGEQRQDPSAQCGDLLLRDRSGNWTYQFAVVVDDLRQGVSLIVRGEDLLGSTGRQLRLGSLLGREGQPTYLHHPLIRKPGGAKLSKAQGDSGIRELRRAGVPPATVLGRAAWLTGLTDRPRELRPDDVPALFAG